jgi:hypothetical protein
MSLAPLNIIMDRIKSARTRSPIAVFTGGGNQLDAMFSNTIETQKLIDKNDPFLVGVYAKGQDLKAVESELKAALGHDARDYQAFCDSGESFETAIKANRH